MAKHVCPNRFAGEEAKGGRYVEIDAPFSDREGFAHLNVGWSCVVVHDKEIPISWISEVIAIATGHEGGIEGFLRANRYGGDSYALMVDPATETSK